MKKFIRDNFKEGRILFGRNTENEFASLIRLGIGSQFNHNATSAISAKGVLGFNEAMPPKSKHTSLDEYERLMNEEDYVVRVYRFKGVSDLEHSEMARYYTHNLLGLDYPAKGKMVLLASRLVNLFADRVKCIPAWREKWCTALCQRAAVNTRYAVLDNPFKGKVKGLPTPRTFENRLVQGIFIDETDLWIKDVKSGDAV